MTDPKRVTCPGCGAVIELDTGKATFAAESGGDDEAPDSDEIEPGDGQDDEADPGEGSGQADGPERVSEAPRRRNRFWR